MDQPRHLPYVPTLGNAVADAAASHPDRVYLAGGGREWTFAEVDAESRRIAAALLAQGVGKGTRVAVLMGQTPQWVLTWLAAGRLGAVTVPISTLFQPPELAWLLRCADVDTVLMETQFAGTDFVERMVQAMPALADASVSSRLSVAGHPYLRRIVAWGSAERELPEWASRGEALAPDARWVALAESAEREVTPADLCVGICTSGTTAEPKLVMHSHGAVVRMTHAYRQYRSDVVDSTIDLVTMPMFWVGGLNGHVLLALHAGSQLVFAPSPEIDDVIDAVVRYGVTRMMLFPARLKAVAARANELGHDLSSVGGVGAQRLADGQEVAPDRRGGNLLGMTETFGPHSFQNVVDPLPADRAGSAGHALAGIDRRAVDPLTGEPLAPGDTGTLQVRGFSMMDGYYKRERADVFTIDGWFQADDLCHFDADGFVYFHSRNSDMIKSAGANVAPGEVEVALMALDEVREAIVFGVPDERRGEAVVAVVVAADGHAIDPGTIRSTLRTQLSSYKVPSEILVVGPDEIPRTGAGKAKRHALRASVMPRLAQLITPP